MTCLPKIAALLSLLSPRNGRPLKMQPLLCGGSVSKWLNLAVSHSRSPSPQEQCTRAGTAPAWERVPAACGRRTPTHGGSATAAAPVCYQARGTFTPEEDAGDEPWEEEALEQRGLEEALFSALENAIPAERAGLEGAAAPALAAAGERVVAGQRWWQDGGGPSVLAERHDPV